MDETTTWLEAAIGQTDLGDQRLRQRLVRLVRALLDQPNAALSQACGSWAATLGAYRFWQNPRVEVHDLSQSIGLATAQRGADQAVVLLVQDSTTIQPRSPRRCQGLGPLSNGGEGGLWLQTTLAVSPEGLPLGVLDQQLWIRDARQRGKAKHRATIPIAGKESVKWLQGLGAAQARLVPGQAHITIADREADIFEVYALAQQRGGDLVVRVAQDRALVTAAGRLAAVATGAPIRGTFAVDVPRADGQPARTAQVVVRSTVVTLKPPAYQSEAAARRRWWAAHPAVVPLVDTPLIPLTLGLVEVREREPPAGVAPLHWRLLTSLPVGTLAQAQHCIALYRQRWLVERFHYVLKSGCRVEQLQLEQAERLERAVLTYSLVAWLLLWLTFVGRVLPEAPCTVVFTPAAWQAVATVRPDLLPSSTTPPDLATMVQAVGRLGGHLGRTRDGPPGPKTLWQGLQRLVDITATWQAVQDEPPTFPVRTVYV